MPQAENRHLGHDGHAVPEAFYVRLAEDRLVSTLHAQGAWQPGEQHLAPASGLLVAEVERRLPSDKHMARASFDILGVIYSGPAGSAWIRTSTSGLMAWAKRFRYCMMSTGLSEPAARR